MALAAIVADLGSGIVSDRQTRPDPQLVGVAKGRVLHWWAGLIARHGLNFVLFCPTTACKNPTALEAMEAFFFVLCEAGGEKTTSHAWRRAR